MDADDKKEGGPFTFQKEEEDRDFDLANSEPDAPLPLTVTSRVLYMLGDITAGPAYRFAQWLELVRKRSSKYRASGFPHRPYHAERMPLSQEEYNVDIKITPPEQGIEISLWERLGKADMLDIESSTFSWSTLSSLHHTEHGSSTEHSEDEMNKALEVTVNSGGVVFFALFNQPENDESSPKEAAAVIKFSSSRMATQSERLGYEFAKWLGVRTPQARVIHNASPEWLQIKEAAEKAKDAAIAEGDEIGEMTCSELLEALELSRCLLLMNYVHGSPLLENSNAFESREAEKTAAALGRILMLDLVIRNEDRLPCRQLRWRGNSANLLLAEKVPGANIDALEVAFDSAIKRYRPKEWISSSTEGFAGISHFPCYPSPETRWVVASFLSVINKSSCGDIEKEELVVPETPSPAKGIEVHCPSSPSKERIIGDHTADLNDSESQRTAVRPPSSGHRESLDSCSPLSREGWHGKFGRGSGEPLRSLRLTSKLRDFHRFAKVDSELYKELEQWNDMLKNDAIKLCQENNFTTGFFEGSDTNYVVDAYELKVRLEHILERMGLISDAANTEKPSPISGGLFIGGALAARSVYTLQLLGITHILCLCSNEIGQEDSQFPELFEYKNFSICDNEEPTSVRFSKKHMILSIRNFTLLEAWNALKQAHRRAQPNDGFARILLELDQKLHGRVSMEWQQRRPVMKVCPICGKNAGLSSSSLKLHLQKAHKKLSSGSVDSAMNMEIQKALDALKISRGGSVSPTQRQSHSMTEE
ncbi:UNVERIFIED_CONTAM: Dual specificity protein phosphatase PHS1 [Sesamum radiatum]|uniref:Dual specificity protein phosphatase PHS1 n=1 Tax=Sesamum radiatum TaxID=300843 RepID=A0AAW2WKM2_SESRA